MFSTLDHEYMGRALTLAALGRFTTHPNPNVGCVLVKEGRIVGEGWHRKAGEPHAEVHALRAAGEQARGATAYVTLEPCSHHGRTPPCALALLEAGVSRVVAAMVDPNPLVAGRGLRILAEAGVTVQSGLREAEAIALNPGFIQRMKTGLPWVRVKLAASLDGRTALANGQSQWITGPAARADVQEWRARSSAILSGADTVLVDDPALNVRWAQLPAGIQERYPETELRQPLRVLVDSRQRLQPEARLFSLPGPVLLARQVAQGSWPAQVEQVMLPLAASGKLDLKALLLELGQRGVNEVWVEAGRQLAGALVSGGWVNELILYLAPKLLGEGAQGLLALPQLDSLEQAWQFTLRDVQQIGDDLRLTLVPRVGEE
ncbi:MAG: bifunctional diaminohydroxyphosphoribosylaminopyrimidine deaminase/5-amino-6-(5-phosphoribosylamino)uracil reductase RibD [Aeromonadaceae bacterium]